jgi:hypothetical protein
MVLCYVVAVKIGRIEEEESGGATVSHGYCSRAERQRIGG